MDTHAKRRNLHIPEHLGEKIADAVCAGMGSWRFIIIQSIIVLLWMVLNLVGWSYHWDPMPFILLNLVFSTQAAYASPLILMSQNRAAARDRKRDDLEAQEIQSLYDGHALLLQINKQQIEMLNQQTEMLERHREMLTLLREGIPPPSPSQRRKKGES